MPFQMHSVAAFDDAKLVFFLKNMSACSLYALQLHQKIAKFRDYSA